MTTWKISCLEKLLPFFISLLLVDDGVELLLTPNMSSSSSSSSKNFDCLAFLAVDLGLAGWNKSSTSSSKIDWNVLLSLSFLAANTPLPTGGVFAVDSTVGGVFVTDVASNRTSEAKMSSTSEYANTLPLGLLDSFFRASFDSGNDKTEGLGDPFRTVCWEGGEAAKTVGVEEVEIVELLLVWLALSGRRDSESDRLGFGPDAAVLVKLSLSSTDLCTAFCLAALVWGLRWPAPLVRLCRTEDTTVNNSHCNTSEIQRYFKMTETKF